MVIGDDGNLRPGTPTLTTALRGDTEVEVAVRTLKAARHSGLYGGAAPDALLTLIAALATSHDAKGDVAVRGLRREPWVGLVNGLAKAAPNAEIADFRRGGRRVPVARP